MSQTKNKHTILYGTNDWCFAVLNTDVFLKVKISPIELTYEQLQK